MRPHQAHWSHHIRAMLLVGLILFSSCTPLPTELPPTPTPILATLTPTATIDWFPATLTATLGPTRTLAPTPDMRPGQADILLEDDFSQTGPWQTSRSAKAGVAYGQDELTLAIDVSKVSLTSLRSEPVLTDFYLEINAQPTLCSGTDVYGLLLRVTSPEDYYRLLVRCDGFLRLERVLASRVSIMQDWTEQISPPFATRLGIWFVGSEIRVFINDMFQFAARDPVFTSGHVGVFARSGGEKALTVNFSNLVVYGIDRAAIPTPTRAPTATPTP